MQLTHLLHPDFCLYKPASHTRETGSTHWLCTAVARALRVLLPTAACLLSTVNTTSHYLFSGSGCDEPDPKAGFPSGSADCSLEAYTHKMCKSHTCQLQLLLAIKMATPPVQAASFYRSYQMTFHPSQSLLQRPLSMILPYYFFSQALGIYLV